MSTPDDTIVNPSAPALSHRMLSPDLGDGDDDATLLRAEDIATNGVPIARDADEDRPTLPIAREQPRVQSVDEELTLPRKLPTR